MAPSTVKQLCSEGMETLTRLAESNAINENALIDMSMILKRIHEADQRRDARDAQIAAFLRHYTSSSDARLDGTPDEALGIQRDIATREREHWTLRNCCEWLSFPSGRVNMGVWILVMSILVMISIIVMMLILVTSKARAS